ncbi:hypothetical protein CAEBREN_17749 [Caenorhabditis brenneri]|uniref:Sdz-33 F-box domain-containing protein n=1 Tax=Caenorhabditis brenneri TaxID=135651 RepID=G0NUC5_CAEBE|nr:hypothetical protein CAEBREN_17749 [Caenorhabditis brenneri]
MVFYALKLPQVALGQVLRGFDSSDLFEMHHCSIETSRVLRQFEKQNKTMKVRVDFFRNCVKVEGVHNYHVLDAEEDRTGLQIIPRTFDGTVVPTTMFDKFTIVTYWPKDEEVEGTKKIATEMIRSLALGQLKDVYISVQPKAQEIVEWVQNMQVKMESFCLCGTSLENKDALADLVFSDEFFRKVNKNYTCLLKPSPDYSPKNMEWDGHCITNCHLALHHTHWFTLEHLKLFNSESIDLYRSILSSADINKYMKLWKEGFYTRLSRLFVSLVSLDGKEFNMQEIIAGIADQSEVRVDENGNQTIELKRRDKNAELFVKQTKKEITFSVKDIPYIPIA